MIDVLAPDYSDLPGRRPVAHAFSAGISAATHIDVSVLTPYYNTEEFFVETWIAIQAQSLQNWEWIIVDDGSTDPASVERLSRVAALDARIQVIHQTNAGPSAARNRAFKAARGRYVCLLDSDDMVEPTYLEKAVWFLDTNPAYAFCNAWSVVFGDQEHLWSTGFERGVAHLDANSGPPISVIRHTAYAQCGGFDESIRFGHEDWDFWLAMAKAGHWGYTLREYLQWYRKRGNGRFEQIMRADGVNAEFESRMAVKYQGLAPHFPMPQRPHAAPYGGLQTQSLVSNPLKAMAAGRRFLFVIPWMVTGGADRVNLDLLEGLVAAGHQVTICATLQGFHRWESEFTRFTPDVFILPNFLPVADYPRFLCYLIQSRGIDTVLLSASTLGYQFLPLLRAQSPDVAFLDMCHVEEPHWQNGGHPRFAMGYQDMLDLNIVTTRHLAGWMQDRGADPERIAVMYTGIRTAAQAASPNERDAIRTEYNIPPDTPLIVFAGRLCEQKRPQLLAHILGTAASRGLPFQALIIGEGELQHDLEDALKKHKLQDRVQLLGSVAHAQWLRILGSADVLLMPSQYEGISVALLEAMAAGVVPVVAKVGGQSEIVGPESGFLIPHGPSELDDYVNALAQVINNPADLAARAAASRHIATTQMAWSTMVHNFLGLVDRAHLLRVQAPRIIVGQSFAVELVTGALETHRLSEAVEWLWHNKPGSKDSQGLAGLHPYEIRALTGAALALGQTRPVRWLIRSKFVIFIARWLQSKRRPPRAA